MTDKSEPIVWKKLECSPGCVAYAPEQGFEHFSVMMSDKEERAAEALVDLARVLESKVRVPEAEKSPYVVSFEPDFDERGRVKGLDYIGPGAVRPEPGYIPYASDLVPPFGPPPYDPDPWTGKIHTVVEMNEIARRTRAAYKETIEKLAAADADGIISEEQRQFAWLRAAHAAVGQPMLVAVPPERK